MWSKDKITLLRHSVIEIIAYFVAAALFSYASIIITGFQFGVSNNVFHIPLVLNLVASPEFSDDEFYRSLSNFTSIVWLLFKTITNESNIENVFYISHFLSRTAAFLCLIVLAKAVGIKPNAAVLLFVACAALTPWHQGVSLIGGHGMFIGYFTHSELTWPLIFIFLTLLSQNKYVPAAAANGLVFTINAFVGIWLLAGGLFILLIEFKAVSKMTIVKSMASFAIVASPVIIWIAISISGSNAEVIFNYLDYIRAYYPGHSLIEAASFWSIKTFVMVFFAGFIAAQYFENKKFWMCIQIAFMLIFLIGVPLPYVIDNRFVHNLALLRSSGVEQSVAIVLILAAGTKMVQNGGNRHIQLLGYVVLFSLVVLELSFVSISLAALSLLSGVLIQSELLSSIKGHFIKSIWLNHAALITIYCLLFLFLFEEIAGIKTDSYRIALLVVATVGIVLLLASFYLIALSGKIAAIVFLVFGIGVIGNSYSRNRIEINNTGWDDLVSWIKSSGIQGEFLLSVNDSNTNQFQLQARKTIWVDWKQGAAVMWSPDFYKQWMPRHEEVKNLETPEEFIDYAIKNEIPNVVIRPQEGSCPSPARLVKETPTYLLCSIGTIR